MTPELRRRIEDSVRRIPSGDATEEDARRDLLQRLKRGDDLIRRDVAHLPDPHLVSYFVVTDGQQMLLVDHIKASLWLPPGGHVEPDEHPDETATREFVEELGTSAELWFDGPQFLTCQVTQGTKRHHDMSLWYVMRGTPETLYDWDPAEFHDIRWFAPQDIPFDRAEPQLSRFMSKMKTLGLFKHGAMA